MHSDLPREGPGDAESLRWACALAGVGRDARILDAGAGPGADVAGLLEAAPKGHVTAIEAHAPFAQGIAARHAGDPRVSAVQGDMAAPPGGPFDFVWSAGAVYFLGVEAALRAWAAALAPGGAVAFSEVVWLGADRPPDAAAFWKEYPAMTDTEGVTAAIGRAGYAVLGTRVLGDAAWEGYFQPMEARIAMLRASGASPALEEVLRAHETEIAVWRAHRDAFGYRLFVVRPE
nr:class I SAM-dependent methyltransferase [Halovulum dunhuangense]